MASSMFSNAALNGRPIHVIGGGSLGGDIAHMLFRKEVPELHLWDFDVVQRHNLFNQRFEDCDVNEKEPVLKIEAHARIMRNINPHSRTKLVLHAERVVAGIGLSGIVIAAVDWNRIRYEEVWPCVRMNPNVSFFADGRVGIDGGKAYGVDPNNENHVFHYEGDPLHNRLDPPNGEIEAACKSDFPMPENAALVAAEVLWRLTRWLHLEQGSHDPYDNFVGWQFRSRRTTLTEQWDKGTIRTMHTLRDGIAIAENETEGD